MRVALIQMSSSDDPADNIASLRDALPRAKAEGAQIVCTPEMTNIMTADRAHLRASVRAEGEDPTLAALREMAAGLGLWVAIGSLAVESGDADGRLANRSFLIDAAGGIAARYDKIHMFDVEAAPGEVYRESAAFRPGDRAVVADTPWARLGLTICYDLRFPHLHRALAQAGAEVILNPAAFTVPTGRAHWETLLRARAIETGAFVLAAAQTGLHPARPGAGERRTWGHALAIAPTGAVLADAGEAPGIVVVDLDLALVKDARRRIPALTHDRTFAAP